MVFDLLFALFSDKQMEMKWQVAQTHPQAVISCNSEMDTLVTDTNRSIATLAITTLLKTGSESSVDRLMKQISTFLGEISDEFKQVVVEALQGTPVKS
jgi:coatomer protein complex subunit gamma